jgi:hypothetical protein
VDGLIWQLNDITIENDVPWRHEATLNAFGYVQASKQNRKFISISPDSSYALIVDMRTHLYLYKQQACASNLPGASLRNRKTGQTVEHIAKQHMISLENHQDIRGVWTNHEHIYILIANQFFVISL